MKSKGERGTCFSGFATPERCTPSSPAGALTSSMDRSCSRRTTWRSSPFAIAKVTCWVSGNLWPELSTRPPPRLGLDQHVRPGFAAGLGLQRKLFRKDVPKSQRAHRVEEPDAVTDVQVRAQVSSGDKRGVAQPAGRLDLRLVESDLIAHGAR